MGPTSPMTKVQRITASAGSRCTADPSAWAKVLRACGKRMRAARLAAGLTQAQAAETAQMSNSGYGLAEDGASAIRLSTLVRIAVALRVDPCELVPTGTEARWYVDRAQGLEGAPSREQAQEGTSCTLAAAARAG